jgi:hypothetical protein
MKKAEIKRRKRVVPAAGNQVLNSGDAILNDGPNEESHQPEQQATTPVSTTETSAREQEQDSFHQTEEHIPHRTIPVDFTEAFRRRDVPVESKKRTYSASNEDDAYPHPQNVISSSENENIDPSLPHRGSAASDAKESRRAELRREAENMRQLLLAKEKELAALGE